jgi:transposase
VKLDTAKRGASTSRSPAPARCCLPSLRAAAQPVHDRLRRSWRHLDFFQFEAWLHCDVPRVACGSCGKTTQLSVPWARPGSGFTAAFEALALRCAASCRCARPPHCCAAPTSAVAAHRVLRDQAARPGELRRRADRGHRRDQPAPRAELHHRVHDLHAKRLLFATEGATTRRWWTSPATWAHGGDPAEVRHVCMDMSAAYAKGVRPGAAAGARSATTASTSSPWPRGDGRRAARGTQDRARGGAQALLGAATEDAAQQLLWGMRRNPSGWTQAQTNAMHWLQHSTLKSARAWRLKMALREVYARARSTTHRAGRAASCAAG